MRVRLKFKWCRDATPLTESMKLDTYRRLWQEGWLKGFEFARSKLADNIEYHDHKQFITTLGEDEVSEKGLGE